MSLTEAQYFTRRASEQLDRAAHARDADVARVHWELTDLYLSRARDAVTQEVRRGPSGPRVRALV